MKAAVGTGMMRLDRNKQVLTGNRPQPCSLLPERHTPTNSRKHISPSAAKGSSWMGSSQPSSSLQGRGPQRTFKYREKTGTLVLSEQLHCFSQKLRTENIRLSISEKSLQEMIQPPPSLLAPRPPFCSLTSSPHTSLG